LPKKERQIEGSYDELLLLLQYNEWSCCHKYKQKKHNFICCHDNKQRMTYKKLKMQQGKTLKVKNDTLLKNVDS
jgi:hypothetical protein